MTKKKQISVAKVKKALGEVFDPELHISIVDLGLIYQVTKKADGTFHIRMTLTTMGCPLFSIIEEEIYSQLFSIGLKRNLVTIELTFDPPWDIDKMTPRGKAMLGI